MIRKTQEVQIKILNKNYIFEKKNCFIIVHKNSESTMRSKVATGNNNKKICKSFVKFQVQRMFSCFVFFLCSSLCEIFAQKIYLDTENLNFSYINFRQNTGFVFSVLFYINLIFCDNSIFFLY